MVFFIGYRFRQPAGEIESKWAAAHGCICRPSLALLGTPFAYCFNRRVMEDEKAVGFCGGFGSAAVGKQRDDDAAAQGYRKRAP